MSGLARLCKRFGSFTHVDQHGNKTEWYWDHAKDEARIKSEVTNEEYIESEKIKWTKITSEINKLKNNG